MQGGARAPGAPLVPPPMIEDLWKLLEPAGRPVKLETLEGLVVGVGKYQLSGYQTKEE